MRVFAPNGWGIPPFTPLDPMRPTVLRQFLAVAALGAAMLPFQGCGLAQRASGGGYSSGGGGSATLVVNNRGSRAVYALQASPCNDTNWGSDRLGSSVIASGSRKSFSVTPGCWDFRADYDATRGNGNERIQRNVRIGAGSSWTWTVSN